MEDGRCFSRQQEVMYLDEVNGSFVPTTSLPLLSYAPAITLFCKAAVKGKRTASVGPVDVFCKMKVSTDLCVPRYFPLNHRTITGPFGRGNLSRFATKWEIFHCTGHVCVCVSVSVCLRVCVCICQIAHNREIRPPVNLVRLCHSL